MKPSREQSRVIAVVLMAGVLPVLISLAAHFFVGDAKHVQEPLHEAVELAGTCIALAVAMLLLLHTRHEAASQHLFWVVASLVAMGLVDGMHGVQGISLRSWQRHGATLVGGAVFALVWWPLPTVVARRKGLFVSMVAGLALALGLWLGAGGLPVTWDPVGYYTFPVKAANALGGFGFLAATLFFCRRYLRQAQPEDLVFASHTVLFGMASLLFGVSHTWAADWWVTHGFRLLAYSVLLVAAYKIVVTIYRRTAEHAQELDGHVKARTAQLLDANAALQTEIAERKRAEADLDRRGEEQARLNAELTRSNRATLNLMQDAVEARKRLEKTNQDLHREITQRQQAEEFVRSEKLLSDSLINSLPGVFYLFDEHGRFLRWNANLERVTGYSSEELAALSPLDLFVGEERVLIQERIQAVFADGQADAEADLVSKSGGRTAHYLTGLRLEFNGQPCLVGVGQVITGRKQAEAALREEETRYRTLFEQSPDGVLIIDTQTALPIAFNETAARQLGYTREEFARLRVNDYEAVERPEVTRARIEKISREGRDDFETQHRTKTGDLRNVLVTVQTIELSGRPVLHCIFRDITERQRAEAALALNALRIQVLLELHQLAAAPREQVLDFALAGSLRITQSEVSFVGFLDETEAVLTIHRWSKEVMAQCALGDQTLALPVAEAGLWSDCVRQRKPVLVNDYAAPHPAKKGLPEGHVPVRRLLAVPIFDGARIVAVAAVANKPQDYTEADAAALTSLMNKLWEILRRQQTDQELALQARTASIFLTVPDEEMFNEVLKVILDVMQSPFGVFGYLDEAGALVVPTMTRQIWDKCQVPDKTITFPRETWGDSSWPRAIREKKANYSNEVSAKTPEGHVTVTRHISVPVLFQGEVIGLLQVANKETDYTEADVRTLETIAAQVAPLLSARLRRERAQEALRKLNTELEQRVQDRTAQLEAANKELEAFSYSVSHDLRAPLRAIDGYGRILVEDYAPQLGDEGRRVLGVISSETRRMGQLVDDLLAFSRLGRQQLESADINMTALAKAVFDEQAALARQRVLQLELKPLPAVHGDRAMLRVVLVNLISNAIKFTKPRNPAVIEIGVMERWSDGTMVDSSTPTLQHSNAPVFYVRDNGVGFDMHYAHKLFGVFQRLHSAEEFEGTGVGLALVQRIVRRHGGRVWAEAKVNEGATFYFTLKGEG